MNTTTLSIDSKLRRTARHGHPSAFPSWQHGLRAGQAAIRFLADDIVAPLAGGARGAVRGIGLAVIITFALADALGRRLIAMAGQRGLARAQARWLHRWSRVAVAVLGLHPAIRGYAPVSGVVVASYTSLLDALVLAAIHPCVFVAGPGLQQGRLIRLLARCGGTIFVQSSRGVDLQLATFAIERAVLRRQVVVIFPECNPQCGFSSALFHPAAELGCTVTATAIRYQADATPNSKFKIQNSKSPRDPALPELPPETTLLARVAHVITRRRTPVTVAFDGPRFHQGDRKLLAHQLRGELLALDPAALR